MSDIPQEFTEELARLSLELAKTRVAIERLITEQASRIERLRLALELMVEAHGANHQSDDMLRRRAKNRYETETGRQSLCALLAARAALEAK